MAECSEAEQPRRLPEAIERRDEAARAAEKAIGDAAGPHQKRRGTTGGNRQQRRGPAVKPKKPYADFPLFPHATRRWAKKIGGRFEFFGPWDDPMGALERYLAKRDVFQLQRSSSRRGAASGGSGGSGGSGPSARVGSEPLPRSATAGAVAADAGGAVTPASTRRGGKAGHLGGHVAGHDGSTADAVVAGGAHEASALGPSGGGGGGTSGGVTVRDLVNHYLTAKTRRIESGELGRRTFIDYHAAAKCVVDGLGARTLVSEVGPAQFARLRAALAKGRGPTTLGILVGRVRSIFKHGHESGLLEVPVKFGPEFVKPSARVLRVARRSRGEQVFEPEEIAALLAGAGVQVRAMILLGLNCGMGNTDVAALPRKAIDLKAGVVDFARPKTGVERRAVLWPETVEAVRAALKARPKPKQAADADLVFVTRGGRRWVRVQEPKRATVTRPAVLTDAVSLEFGKLMREAGVYRPRRGFYALRHTFRTIADEVGDRRAIDLVMGHENGNDISTHYVERISDERLRKVVEHVRGWVFGRA